MHEAVGTSRTWWSTSSAGPSLGARQTLLHVLQVRSVNRSGISSHDELPKFSRSATLALGEFSNVYGSRISRPTTSSPEVCEFVLMVWLHTWPYRLGYMSFVPRFQWSCWCRSHWKENLFNNYSSHHGFLILFRSICTMCCWLCMILPEKFCSDDALDVIFVT